ESDQMMIRSVPNETDVIFAVVSAIAAGVIISKGQSLSIVGVAIAASLAPPAATIGLYLAFNDLAAAQGAGLLLLINILAINASCSIMFTIFRLQSKAGISMRMSLRAQRINRLMIGSVLLLFFILSGFLVYRAISGDS
ncbi:MAG: DUF389 domain-containing protein, partial [Candidatus Heimdallarchaeota archaeon]|nr:DUF389 domain-containing protein [Candidatus Heimdallarchaeota archaeon]